MSYEELSEIVRQGKEMGTHFYMFTGGEPLVRKDDVIRLCEENPDCAFLPIRTRRLSIRRSATT